MARPRHLGDDHPVLAAADAWCHRFHIEAGVAQIEATPPATSRSRPLHQRRPSPWSYSGLRRPQITHRCRCRRLGRTCATTLPSGSSTRLSSTLSTTPRIRSHTLRPGTSSPSHEFEHRHRNRSWGDGVPLFPTRWSTARSTGQTTGPLAEQLSPRPRRGPVTREAERACERSRLRSSLDGERGRGRLPDSEAVPSRVSPWWDALASVPGRPTRTQIEINVDPRLRHKSR